jgi:hypothetical protein
MQKPTVGRIVHYTPDAGEEQEDPWPAMIVFVSAVESVDAVPLVNLTAWDNIGRHRPLLGVAFSEKPTPGCWSWPPRAT